MCKVVTMLPILKISVALTFNFLTPKNILLLWCMDPNGIAMEYCPAALLEDTSS